MKASEEKLLFEKMIRKGCGLPFREGRLWCTISFSKKNEMKKSNYLIWLGIAAAAGTAIGALSERRNTARGGLLGAAARHCRGSSRCGGL